MRLVLLVTLAASAALGGWLPEERITNRPTLADRTSPNNARCLAVDSAGNVHAVWYGLHDGRSQIWYSWRSAVTNSWSADTIISDDAERDSNPSVAVDAAGNLHVTWQVYRLDTALIRYRVRDGASGDWRPAETVARMPGGSSPSVVGLDSQHAVVAWDATSPSTYRNVFVATRDQAGWSVPLMVSVPGVYGQSQVCIAEFGDSSVAAVWRRGGAPEQILFRANCTTAAIELDTLFQQFDCSSPCLSPAGAGNVDAVWYALDGSQRRLIHRRVMRAGHRDSVVVQAQSRSQGVGSVASRNSGHSVVCWIGEDASNVVSPFLRISDSTGTLWSDTVRVDSAARVCNYQHVAWGPEGSLNVLWTDGRSNPACPDIYFRRWEFVRDVAVLGFESLPGTADSGAAVVPKVSVANFGDTVERNVPVWFHGPGVSADTVLDSLAKGDTVSVEFDTLVCLRRGWNSLACSTWIDGDRVRSNDVVRDSLFVVVRDAAVESIVAPRGQVLEDSVTPVVELANHGNLTAQCTCAVTIVGDTGLVYSERLPLLLAPDSNRAVVMPSWRCLPGHYSLTAVARLAGDMVPANDSQVVQFTVPLHDVGVDRILAPVGRVDSGSVVAPEVRVFNVGGLAETLAVSLRIGTSAPVESLVAALAPGESASVQFPSRTMLERGAHPVVCTVRVRADHDLSNNAATESMFVLVVDAVAKSIEVPREVVGRGSLSPEVVLGNNGTQSESVLCRFEILKGDTLAYADSVVSDVSAGSDTTLTFRLWATQSGSYRAVFSVRAADEMRPENDSVAVSFRVTGVDAAAIAIVAPVGVIPEGDVQPAVRIANLGDEAADIRTEVTIEAGGVESYRDSVQVIGVAPGCSATAVLPVWQATRGEYSVTASVRLRGDINPGNDELQGNVLVETTAVFCWNRLADIPAGPRRRPVLDGGALAAADGRLYALKGGTRELWRYSPAESLWTACAEMPGEKRTGGGAGVAWDGGGGLYATPGRGSGELYRYDIAAGTWQACASLPPHVRTFRRGTALAFDSGDTAKLFVVKGAGSLDLLSYLPAQGRWQARRPMPAGPRGRKARKGTCIAGVGGRLFCLKGGTVEFFEYFPERDSWTARAELPCTSRSGRLRVSGGGAAMAWDGGDALYLTKGRGLEFWRYIIAADAWEQVEDVPQSVPRRPCRRGTALAMMDGSVYLVRGNATREFWRYDPLTTARPERVGVALNTGRPGREARAESGSAALPVGPGWRYYDASGRQVRSARGFRVVFAVSPGGTVKRVMPFGSVSLQTLDPGP